MPLLKFVAEPRPTSDPDYHACAYLGSPIQIIITTSVKTVIDLGQWKHCSREDREEIRNLRELGLLIEAGS